MIINSIKDMINLVKGQAYYNGLYIKPQETRIGNRARTEPTCDHVWPLSSTIAPNKIILKTYVTKLIT
jgi:hypothetical protein